MNINTLGRMACLAAAAAAASCGGGGGISGTGAPAGTLKVSLTDAPSCGYDAVNVTVQKVRVHQSASAADADGGWSEVVLSPARRIDLTTLTNGVLDELGETTLPAGKYTQLRLVLADNDSTAPLTNSVRPTGSVETALTTPSGQQSGLKLNVDIDVPTDKRVDVVIDFDVCKSVVRRGNSGQYNLKPVLTVTPLLSDAGMRVVGYVSPALASGSTSVAVQLNGTQVKATPPNPTTGQFVLYPVPAGTYDLVVSSSGRVTAVMTGVPVVTTAYTYVNSASVPIAPAAASATRAVNGTVTPATATVRALQSLAGGPTIESAFAPVDVLSGAFSFLLPVDPPVKAAYVANPTALNFTADTAANGLYTVEAASAGALRTLAIDTKAVVPPLSFSFP